MSRGLEGRWAASIWQGRLERVITYYTNHNGRMRYPEYRLRGLTLTSSHIESTIKQINALVNGTETCWHEAFWYETSGNAVRQLRADARSDTRSLGFFWIRWRIQQTGTNANQNLATQPINPRNAP